MLYAVLNINTLGEDEFKKYYSLMPEKRKAECDRFSSVNDKKLCVGAYMLLCQITGSDKITFCYSKTGKPYIKDNPFFISISHSENYAAAAVADSPVGIDIETVSNVKDSVIKRICTDNEIKYINETGIESFYKIWTYKEAYFKMTGEGIGAGLKNVDYTKRNKQVISLIQDGYALCVINNMMT